jgi:hypothetical protein
MTMSFKHPRNIITDPDDVDIRIKKAEQMTVDFLSGRLSEAEYYRHIDEMQEYVDLRRMASEVLHRVVSH